MPFDPDAYLASKQASSFDPDAYLASKATDPTKVSPMDFMKMTPAQQQALQDQSDAQLKANNPAPPTKTDSLVAGAENGGSFGFSNAIKGATGAISDQLHGDDRSLIDNYRGDRDQAVAAQNLAQKTNPVSYGAGDVAGSVASGLAAAPLGVGLVGQGALMGLGNSKADLTKGELNQAAYDTSVGGLTGKAFAVAPAAASKTAQLASDYTPQIVKDVGSSVKDAIMNSKVVKALQNDPQALESFDKPSFTLGALGAAKGYIEGGLGGAYAGYHAGSNAPKLIGKGLSMTGKAADATGDFISNTYNKIPDQYKKVMGDAAAAGGNSFAVKHFILSQQDPNYAKHVAESDNDQTNSIADASSKPQMVTGSD